MNNSSLLSLIQNISLLLANALIFDLVIKRKLKTASRLWQIPLGIVLGGGGIALMLTPWVFSEEIIFTWKNIETE